MREWNILNQEEQINQIIQESFDGPVAIFKHSTTCGISHSAKSRVEQDFVELSKEIKFYYLDLLTYRSISNAVARELGVIHQSPQLIVLKNGSVIHTSSHYGIQPQKLMQAI